MYQVKKNDYYIPGLLSNHKYVCVEISFSMLSVTVPI